MFVFYRLLRCYLGTPSSHADHASSISTSPTAATSEDSAPEKDRAQLVWLAAFATAVWLHFTAKLVIRALFFSSCTLLVSVIDGSLNLLVGHAVLQAAHHDHGYDRPLLASIEAGSIGGFLVIGPTTLATVATLALLGGPDIQKDVSLHVAVLFELAAATAVSCAAASAGVAVVRRIRPDDRPPLDPLHAARAGALGACLLTVPIVSAAAWLWLWTRKPRTTPSAQALVEGDTPPAPTLSLSLTDGLGRPLSYDPSTRSPRVRPRPRIVSRAVVETVGYVFVTLCILSIRLLCF